MTAVSPSSLPDAKPGRYWSNDDFDRLRAALLVLGPLLDRIGVVEAALGIRQAFQEPRTEAVSIMESMTVLAGGGDGRAEPLSVTELGTDSLDVGTGSGVEPRSEGFSIASLLVDKFGAREAGSESVTVTEYGQDVVAQLDTFQLLWSNLPRPTQPGKYPYWQGAWTYQTAEYLAQTLMSGLPPVGARFDNVTGKDAWDKVLFEGPGNVLWIDTSGLGL